MRPLKSTVKPIIVFCMIISCLFGFYFEIKRTLRYCDPNNWPDLYYSNYIFFANLQFNKLKDSAIINGLKDSLGSKGAAGFYSNELTRGYVMFVVLQHLLAPVLLDREKYGSYDYVVIFSRQANPSAIAFNIGRKICKNFGNGIYLAIKK